MAKEVLVVGEAHPEQSERNMIRVRKKYLDEYRRGITLMLLKTYVSSFKEKPLGLLASLTRPVDFIKISRKYIRRQCKIFEDQYGRVTHTLHEMREMECDLIRRYKPDKIFVEVMRGREDLRRASDDVGAKIIDYEESSPNVSIFIGEAYETYLLKDVLLTAYSSSRPMSIIGAAHLRATHDVLKREKFEAGCIYFDRIRV